MQPYLWSTTDYLSYFKTTVQWVISLSHTEVNTSVQVLLYLPSLPKIYINNFSLTKLFNYSEYTFKFSWYRPINIKSWNACVQQKFQESPVQVDQQNICERQMDEQADNREVIPVLYRWYKHWLQVKVRKYKCKQHNKIYATFTHLLYEYPAYKIVS